ncbi:MAG: lamin tail domain-containing protein [Flavobacteriia bacterium]|nr:lamin tail domain-containing protein [Flavobacteriia bacterium]
MKALYLIVGLTAIYAAQAQSSWYDSFSDSSLHQNPVWIGDTARFNHTPNGLLQLSDDNSGASTIYTSSQISQSGYWSGWLAMNFNPSTSNYTDIILCESPTAEAYRLRFGGNAQDRIELLHTKPGIETLLAHSATGILSNSTINIAWQVERFRDSAWSVSVNIDSLGWQEIILHPDSIAFASTFFGMQCNYTKTRADKFFFDDIAVTGQAYLDTVSPSVLRYAWHNRSTLSLELSESCYADSAIVLDQFGVEWEMLFSSASEITLNRREPAHNGAFQLFLATIKDLEGNPLNSISVDLVRPNPSCIQITEIMSDASPAVDIESEYIELLNTGLEALNLSGWTLTINQTKIDLPDTTLIAGQYLVLSNGPLEGTINTYRSSLLPNTSGIIELKDDWGETIDRVAYSSHWHSTPWKSEGGWSLEKDLYLETCSEKLKWSSSKSLSGGTPGASNKQEGSQAFSTNEILSIQTKSDSILLLFDRKMSSVQLTLSSDTFYAEPVDFNREMWQFPSPLDGYWNLQAVDCSGAILDSSTIGLLQPSSEIPSVRILEINPNPIGNQPEFVEIVNEGTSAFLIGDIRIGKWNSESGIEELKQLEPRNQLVLPHEVVLVPKFNNESIYTYYPRSNAKSQLNSELPISLNAKDGICLTYKSGQMIDSVEWSNDSYGEVEDKIGKTLTRSEIEDWRVTPARFNYGTPGVISSASEPKTTLKFEHLAFYANDESSNLKVHLPESWSGSKVSIIIRNKNGNALGKWFEKRLITGFETISWNGMLEGKELPTGQYLIEVQKEDKDGYREVHSQGCLLIQK